MKYLFFVLVFLSISLVSSYEFGYNYLEKPDLNISNIVLNESTNSSDFWDNLDTPADINTGDLTDDGTYLPLAGGTMAGAINMNGNPITGITNLTATAKLNLIPDNRAGEYFQIDYDMPFMSPAQLYFDAVGVDIMNFRTGASSYEWFKFGQNDGSMTLKLNDGDVRMEVQSGNFTLESSYYAKIYGAELHGNPVRVYGGAPETQLLEFRYNS